MKEYNKRSNIIYIFFIIIIFQHSIYIYFMYIKIVVKFYSINNNKVEKKKTNEKQVKT